MYSGYRKAFDGKGTWNPSICICENSEYLASSINDSVIMCWQIVYQQM